MAESSHQHHAHSHSHSHLPSRAVRTAPAVRFATLGLLTLVALATALGLYLLWPDSAKVAQLAERAQFTATGFDYVEGEILSIAEECEETPGSAEAGAPEAEPTGEPEQSVQQACRTATVGLRSGPDAGHVVEVPLRGGHAVAGLRAGDRLELIAYAGVEAPAVGGEAEGGEAGGAEDQGAEGEDPADGSGADDGTAYRMATSYDVSGVFRGLPLAVLALVFAAVVVGVGRIRGLLALVALGVSAGVLLLFVLPALVAGGPGLLIGIVGSIAIMFVILYFVHGPNMRTTAALVGTLCGIFIMAGVSLIAVSTTRLSGVGDEASGLLAAMTGQIDFRGLLSCAIIIAGLGVLNDVTITQASSVWELRAAAPTMSRREIYARGMRIGRDHLASTVYTVFFAYVGAALSVLILIYLYDRPALSLLTREDLAIEAVRTLCGSIGLVLAIPITTWVATLFVPPAAPVAESDAAPQPGVEPATVHPIA